MSRGDLEERGPKGTPHGNLRDRHSEPLTGSVSLPTDLAVADLYSSRLESAYGVDVNSWNKSV